MDFSGLFHFFMHLDEELTRIVSQYQGTTYAILFAVIFCETGLVITPFLPGDSLLFAVGSVASSDKSGTLNVYVIGPTLMFAALCGDNVNYWIGRLFGQRLFRNEKSRIFKKSHLEKTQSFFEKYGGRTIILARFVPIVRTFSPFVAGMGKMKYTHFLAYSVLGAVLWVGICVSAGYLFGQIPAVKENFEWAALAVVAISIVPAIIEIIRHRRKQKAA